MSNYGWSKADWRKPKKKSKVFVSGAMFSGAEKDFQLTLGEALEKAGYIAIVPHRDGIEVAPIMGLLNDPNIDALLPMAIVDRCISWTTRAISCLDIYWAGVDSDCTVLNIDGRVPDEGSLVEGTGAWMAGKPVVLHQTSPIRKLGKNNNPMIGVISDWTKAESTVEGVVRAVSLALLQETTYGISWPRQVVAKLTAGRAIAEWLKGNESFSLYQVGQVLEPEPSLREACKFVLCSLMDFSRAKDQEVRDKILTEGMLALKDWEYSDEAQAALLTPLPC